MPKNPGRKANFISRERNKVPPDMVIDRNQTHTDSHNFVQIASTSKSKTPQKNSQKKVPQQISATQQPTKPQN